MSYSNYPSSESGNRPASQPKDILGRIQVTADVKPACGTVMPPLRACFGDKTTAPATHLRRTVGVHSHKDAPSVSRNAPHPASWTERASIELASPVMFKSSTAIRPQRLTMLRATLWWKSRRKLPIR